MRMTEEEFAAMLANNPCLGVKGRVSGTRPLPDPAKHETETKEVRRKYRNRKVYEYEDGSVLTEKRNGEKPVRVFDSAKEYGRWEELLSEERMGLISDLSRQEKFVILEPFARGTEKVRGISYTADFTYKRNGTDCIEDVKPFDTKTGKHRLTKDFTIKWKLLKHTHSDCEFLLF